MLRAALTRSASSSQASCCAGESGSSDRLPDRSSADDVWLARQCSASSGEKVSMIVRVGGSESLAYGKAIHVPIVANRQRGDRVFDSSPLVQCTLGPTRCRTTVTAPQRAVVAFRRQRMWRLRQLTDFIERFVMSLLKRQAGRRAGRGPASGRLAFLEHRGLEPMALQELVELGAVALGEQRRLRHVAAR